VIKVYKSDVGQYVLVHGPTQTFIIDENLAEGYARLEAHVREHHPDMAGAVLAAGEKPEGAPAGGSARESRLPQLLLLMALAILPFLWLVVLHHSLAAIVTDLRIAPGGVYTVTEESYDAIRQDMETLHLENNRLRQSLYQLRQQVTVLMEAASLVEESAAPGLESEETEGAEDDDETVERDEPID